MFLMLKWTCQNPVEKVKSGLFLCVLFQRGIQPAKFVHARRKLLVNSTFQCNAFMARVHFLDPKTSKYFDDCKDHILHI